MTEEFSARQLRSEHAGRIVDASGIPYLLTLDEIRHVAVRGSDGDGSRILSHVTVVSDYSGVRTYTYLKPDDTIRFCD